MNEEQQLQQALQDEGFLQYLAQQMGISLEQLQQELINALKQDPRVASQLVQRYQEYQQQAGAGAQEQQAPEAAQQAGVPMNRMGNIINHVRRMYGTCPEGYEMTYFKIGGKTCKKCKKKQAKVKKCNTGSTMNAKQKFNNAYK